MTKKAIWGMGCQKRAKKKEQFVEGNIIGVKKAICESQGIGCQKNYFLKGIGSKINFFLKGIRCQRVQKKEQVKKKAIC